MPKPDPAKRQQWEARLKAWELSGMSETKWCLENNCKYHVFKYWKKRLRKPSHAFLELKDQTPLNIEIRIGKMTIHFPLGIKTALIKQYLKTLLELAC